MYVVNSGSGTVTVINAETNTVAAAIRVQRQPYFIDVDAQGDRAYVANSKSNNVSVLDLARRREIAVIGAGEEPGMARIANDGKTLVITNRASGGQRATWPAIQWDMTRDQMPAWLIEECYDTVGDLAETLALLYPDRERADPGPLHLLVQERMTPLRALPDPEKRQLLTA